ncbi:MAG: DNA methyltransferase [Cytophagales bacterium]|nr:MAG: DNA methyltransferase [Cytophagales bacterium]
MSIQKINEYYKCVESVKRFSDTNKESSIRRCFANLIAYYAEKKNLLLVDEFQIEGTRKIADGGLIDKNRVIYGYWEAKDTKDDLEKEIQNKIKIGYPTFNIIFENSEIAVLYQNDVREQCNISDAKALDKMFNKFITYETEKAKNFKEALVKFRNNTPEIIKILEKVIAEMGKKEAKYNPDFVEKREKFYELCKICINPQINYKDIDEMIIQHILTEDVFKNVFTESQFHEENNIAQSLIAIEKTFFIGDFKRNITNKISSYYTAIKEHASSLHSYKEKQSFLKNLYEEFYKAYNPKNADKLGIVYTPSEVVSFMLKMTDALLEKHFDKNLIDKNVHILDPATGTGTFITDLLDYLPHNNKEKFIYKYKNEIHANEVAILPYYIAYLNIENTFLQKMQESMSFDNLCWVDTLDNVEALKYAGKQSDMFELAENTKRIKAQNKQKISVIIGNPPYNARQQNFNDQNANRLYKNIDERIKETFIKQGSAQNQIVLYDMYVRFYAWAMDRIDKNSIIAFITNRSFIESKSFDGFRKIVQNEFDEIYIIDLKGDVRQNNQSEQGGNVFNIMTGVAIAFFIKNEKQKNEKAKIFYHTIGDGIDAQEKLETLQMLAFDKIPFERIRPDLKNNWLNITDNDFQNLIPLIDKEVKSGKKQEAIFQLFSLGVASHRDNWVYDFSKENLKNKMKFFVDIYQKTLKNTHFKDKNKIAWDRELEKYCERKIKKTFENTKIKKCLFRPFTTKYYYFDRHFNGMIYQWENIYQNDDNLVIAVNREGSNKPFHCLVSNQIIDLHTTGDSQCLPFYRYENGEKVENITDWALEYFRTLTKFKTLSKLDIFHYVYAVLHSSDYRKKYEIDLKRDFPRIPLYKDFWKYAEAGEKLMDLHLNYESLTPQPPLHLEKGSKLSSPFGEGQGVRLNRLLLESLLPKRKNKELSKEEDEKLLKKIKPDIKLKVKDGVIEIDELTTISNIPNEVWEYKLGNRTAVEWVLDQHKPYKSSDETIQTQFNNYDFFEYKEELIKLLLQVMYVSVETMKIVKSL